MKKFRGCRISKIDAPAEEVCLAPARTVMDRLRTLRDVLGGNRDKCARIRELLTANAESSPPCDGELDDSVEQILNLCEKDAGATTSLLLSILGDIGDKQTQAKQ